MRTLYYNGHIYTMESQGATVEAVLVENEKIIEVGTNALQLKADVLHNLNGATMLPGFVDVHLHLVMLGKKLDALTIYDHTSTEQVKSDIKNYTSKRKWNLILGYNENNFKNKYKMTKETLDTLTNKPTLVTRTCHHAGLVNSKAFEVANITDDVEDMEGGHFEKDDNGHLTGWVYDKAFELMRAYTVDDTSDSISEDIKRAIHHLTSKGITAAHSEDLSYYGHFSVPLDAYLHTVGPDSNETTFRVRLLNHESQYLDVVNSNRVFKPNFVELDAMKIFTDGSFGSKTALLQDPYEGTNTYGLRIHTQEALEQHVQTARLNEDAIAVHLIGDEAARMTIEAIEKYPPPNGKHDRMIHCSLLNDSLIERMSKLNVVCDIQPTFLSSDISWLTGFVGEERSKYLFSFKSLLNQGIIIGSSSDAPIETVDPLKSIYDLETREVEGEVFTPSERLSRYEAIQTYTTNAAKIAYNEDRFGQIRKNYFADFVIFDKNIMEIEADVLLSTQVLNTIINGEMVYEKN